MHRDARMFFQPCPHFRMLMCCIVIRDQMQVEVARCFAIDLLEEAQPLDMGVPRLGAGDQFAGQLVERGEQRDRAMPNIVMGHGARPLWRQR